MTLPRIGITLGDPGGSVRRSSSRRSRGKISLPEADYVLFGSSPVFSSAEEKALGIRSLWILTG